MSFPQQRAHVGGVLQIFRGYGGGGGRHNRLGSCLTIRAGLGGGAPALYNRSVSPGALVVGTLINQRLRRLSI
jgi:hypothetical protein